MKFDLKRFKNYGLWVAIASLLLIVLQALGVPVIPGQFEAITNMILSLLVAMGVISNPNTDNKGFHDDVTGTNEDPTTEDNSGEDHVL